VVKNGEGGETVFFVKICQFSSQVRKSSKLSTSNCNCQEKEQIPQIYRCISKKIKTIFGIFTIPPKKKLLYTKALKKTKFQIKIKRKFLNVL
jgi:hypothetical protein